MSVPVLATKVHVPIPPRPLVARPRLTATLEAGLSKRLILVSAPAGFGKSTLLAEWAQSLRESIPVAWLHLEPADNQPVRFISYLIAALRTQIEQVGESALSALAGDPPALMEGPLVSLLNDLEKAGQDLILVLDDYHVIEAQQVHAHLRFLIDHLPAGICLVICTRSDPPLTLHSLRARGHLWELRAQDLRFNAAEMETYLESMLGWRLAEAEIDALDRRIEGWIAGLQMAALSLAARADPHEFILSLTASHRYIMDYLTEEIFNTQAPDVQAFLLRTSVLDRLCAPLCEAVIGDEPLAGRPAGGRRSAADMLEGLVGSNLFLHPLDDQRKWYRYHALFASLLRQRLRNTCPEQVEALHRRAFAWFASRGHLEEAFSHALLAEDMQAAAGLVEDHGMQMLERGELLTLLGWLERLPEASISARPWVSVYHAWALLLTGQAERIEPCLKLAEGDRDRDERSVHLRGHVAAIRAYASMWRAEPGEILDLANQAMDLLPQDDLSARAVVSFVMGGVLYMGGKMQEAAKAMLEASRMGERSGNLHLAVAALSAAGDIHLTGMRLKEAESVFASALQIASSSSGRALPIAAGIYSGLARLSMARRDLPKARKYIESGLDLGAQWGNPDSLMNGQLVLAQLEYLHGNLSAAHQALERARQLCQAHDLTYGSSERLAAVEAMLAGQLPDPQEHFPALDPLSPRELEVLEWMARGESNAQIAARLIVAVGTVKAHSSSIYRKLGVGSRAQAVLRARELGLV